jgi:hypothetical protein
MKVAFALTRVVRPCATVLPLLLLLVSCSVQIHAQTIDDGIMIAKQDLLTGNLYSYESWDHYWEGTLKRVNGNIGTITTKTNVWSANYGITNSLNVIATVPYVWTNASQGVLHGIQGFQDITLAGKYKFLEKTSANHGSLRAIAVVSAGIPLASYNPELPPLSVGSGSASVSWRGTLNYQSNPGWFLNSSTAYTWRSQTTLDRPYFFTNGEFVMSDQVDMPNAFAHVASAGYMKGGVMTAISLSQQRTLGGGDIRRQDIPFVSNRMNFSKLGVMVMAPVPKLRALSFQAAVARTLEGRNVGQATAITGGLLYTFQVGPTR